MVLELDPGMPGIYPDFSNARFAENYMSKMLGELTGESYDAGLSLSGGSKVTKIRYRARFSEGRQFLVIEHNGPAIPQDALDRLNRELDEIHRNRETINPGGRGGNKRAAILISSHGGRINLENLTDGEYRVATKVEIPLPR